jgi:hypothetical protein
MHLIIIFIIIRSDIPSTRLASPPKIMELLTVSFVDADD